MLKFDTRNKKPALYNILAISVVTVIILALLLKDGETLSLGGSLVFRFIS